MKVVVTTGPSFEPIDEVRRLTNSSTGELGVILSNTLTRAGFEVFCLRGECSSHPGAVEARHHVPFSTNHHLLQLLRDLSHAHEVKAIFHVAALCDFKVRQVENPDGSQCDSPKLDSRTSGLTIHLEPAKKVIGELRGLFPKASIVGWKYELAGTREEALSKAWRQLTENHTDACMLNGRAWGKGFAFCVPPDQVRVLDSKLDTAQFLTNWLTTRQADRVDRKNPG